MLTWIYERELPSIVFENEDYLYKAAIDLWVVADFHLLTDLQSFLEELLAERLHKKSIWAQHAFARCKNSDHQMTTGDIQGLFDGIERAYAHEMLRWAQRMFVDFAAEAHFWMDRDKCFMALCATVPEYNSDLGRAIAKAYKLGAYCPLHVPVRCAVCQTRGFPEARGKISRDQPETVRRSADPEPNNFHFVEVRVEKGTVKAKCHICLKRPRLGALVSRRPSMQPFVGELRSFIDDLEALPEAQGLLERLNALSLTSERRPLMEELGGLLETPETPAGQDLNTSV
ncbi:hypothetical protein GGR56DRAFT_643348 [Xylariaceae sp. FL0804]|nr:hypothetical protein GGR56DRAFT_643348 [Xylariaceae sp. FL0804]